MLHSKHSTSRRKVYQSHVQDKKDSYIRQFKSQVLRSGKWKSGLGLVLGLGLGPGNTVLDKSFPVTLSVLNVTSRILYFCYYNDVPYRRRVGVGELCWAVEWLSLHLYI